MAIVRTSPETDVVKYVVESLSPYFHYKQEVWGVHLTGRKKRIDLIIYPNQELLAEGFPPIPVGIEMKTTLLVDGNKKQIVELYKQAIQYRHTKFEMKKGYEYLPLILVYPPPPHYLRDSSTDFSSGAEHIGSRLAGKFFIGDLHLPADCPEHLFKIKLCGSWYYSYGLDRKGHRLNMEWGFEKYEDQKRIIQSKNLPKGEYDNEINKLTKLLGI